MVYLFSLRQRPACMLLGPASKLNLLYIKKGHVKKVREKGSFEGTPSNRGGFVPFYSLEPTLGVLI